MGETVDSISAAVADLRRHQSETLALMPQQAVVAALAELADRWRDPAYPLRLEAEAWQEPFPFAMVQVSLNALLDSLSSEKLWELIETEDARDVQGYPVVGHVIAGNTPLLAWVSIIRALLVRSASLVKLPSNASAQWADIFHRSLREIEPGLASCVQLVQWPGGTTELDAVVCTEADIIMVQGSDATLARLQALCPAGKPFIGYGHRVSFGLLLPDADIRQAALGFAKDVLMYDQGGCLSPQTIFVEGDFNSAQSFAATLAEALAERTLEYPLPFRATQAAQTVREARALAWMEEGNAIWEDPNLRWTVIARPQSGFAASPTFGVVSVQPLASLIDLPLALSAVADRLQGCAFAGKATNGYLIGVSHFCSPGELQAPPLSWRQDGRDVLRILLPPNCYRADGSTTTRISPGKFSGQSSSVDDV
ncbi:MAG: acyl-CoA reductase [Janthinobacterium lividum]